MTEVLQKVRPEWGEKVRNKVQQKLHKVDVTDVDKLCFAVMENRLNSLLTVAAEKRLSAGTMMKLRVQLGKRYHELTSPDDSNPAAEIGKPKQCFCMQCLQKAGNPCLGVRSGHHLAQGFVQGCAKVPLDFGLSNVPTGELRGARPSGSRVRGVASQIGPPPPKGLPGKALPGSRASSEGELQFSMGPSAKQPQDFFPRMEAKPLQKSYSEPFIDNVGSVPPPVLLSGRRVSGSMHGQQSSKGRHRSNPALDRVPPAGGMRRDDDALDSLLKEAAQVISRGETIKKKIGFPPMQPASRGIPIDLPKDIPECLNAPAVPSSKTSDLQVPDSLDALFNCDDFCLAESKVAAQSALDDNRTEVSSAHTLTAAVTLGQDWQPAVLGNNGAKWEPPWRRGKREQITKFYGEDSALRRRTLLAQAL